MKSHDSSQLSAHLTRLAETFDRKPLTAEAFKVWFDTLKEFPAELIFALLAGWPKQHQKFPVPSELWQIANNSATADRERSAALQRSVNSQPVRFERTQNGRFASDRIKELLGHSRVSPVDHWLRVQGRSHRDSIGYRYAVEALAKLQRGKRMREPGEDRDEA